MEDARARLRRLAQELARLGRDVDSLRGEVDSLITQVFALNTEVDVAATAVRGVEASVAELSRRVARRTRSLREHDASGEPAMIVPFPAPARGASVVVVVDDDDESRRVATDSLGDAGFAVRPFCAAEDALGHLSHEVPRAALISLALPGMPGAALAEYLGTNARTYRVCRLAMTEFVPSVQQSRLFHAMIEKPVVPGALVDFLSRSLARWGGAPRR